MGVVDVLRVCARVLEMKDETHLTTQLKTVNVCKDSLRETFVE